MLDFGIDPETGKQVKQTKTFPKLTDWLETVVKPNRAETTVYDYQKIIDKHLIPALGSIPLQKLTPQKIQHYYAAKVREDGLSPNSVRKHHDLLSSALRVAVKQDLLFSSPISKVEPPTKVPTYIHFYTPGELQRLLELVAGTNLEVLVKLAGYLGLRREEILGLTWPKIDFDQSLLRIEQARTAAGSTIVEKSTKTLSSTRSLHMPDDVVDVLRREKAKQEELRAFFQGTYHDSEYVFTREDSRLYRPNYVSDMFIKFIRDNDLPYITLHGLRQGD